ncbi:Hypothetical predicted protein [Paramuricea clavata]|uniref:Uncharacterized protein n=1 Tax=Paramuricea clavata TaxID=317549 RepID=A0A7D9EM44_PARCT|nr:Hypothetical predicted protein [Paramuricea clavata]
MEKVNKSATFKPKLLQGRQGVQGPIGPKGPIGDQGPKGIQGIQGPQGIPGMGNVSRCTHKTRNSLSTVLKIGMELNTRANVVYNEPQGMKVMAATCSTSHEKGSGAAYLLTKEVNGILRYTCECAGISAYGLFKPVKKNRNGPRQMECIIHIWECPL